MGLKIRKGDFVQVIKGKDSGKKGRVIRVYPKENRALVEGVNFVKKHVRPRKIDQQGGIVSMEKPVPLANLKYFCMKCGKPTRVRFRLLPDGNKLRCCAGCQEIIEPR
ncbi:MAG TPA: 50S ribosomal protein L24 [bacterium]|nr:50S ribosomal protein L24 [bacterium]HPP12294.1 50S ribosomal protein L24 [bacterium]